MVTARDIEREEARKRRVLSKLGADQRERSRHLRITRALEQSRLVLSDCEFLRLIHLQGFDSAPTFLLENEREESALDRTLEFVVTWRFFAPLLYDPITSEMLDARWPGFGIELRDIFISIVSDSPFPHELRGRGPRA